MSAFYVVAYASLSIPAILAGVLVTPLGLRPTFERFASVVAALALVVAFEAWRGRPPQPSRRSETLPEPLARCPGRARRRRRRAGPRPVTWVDDLGLVAVLEVAAADAVEQRRGRRRSTLVAAPCSMRLERGTGRPRCAAPRAASGSMCRDRLVSDGAGVHGVGGDPVARPSGAWPRRRTARWRSWTARRRATGRRGGSSKWMSSKTTGERRCAARAERDDPRAAGGGQRVVQAERRARSARGGWWRTAAPSPRAVARARAAPSRRRC